MDRILELWPSLTGQRILFAAVGGTAMLGLLLLQFPLDGRRVRPARERGLPFHRLLLSFAFRPFMISYPISLVGRVARLVLSVILLLSCAAFMTDILMEVVQAIETAVPQANSR